MKKILYLFYQETNYERKTVAISTLSAKMLPLGLENTSLIQQAASSLIKET